MRLEGFWWGLLVFAGACAPGTDLVQGRTAGPGAPRAPPLVGTVELVQPASDALAPPNLAAVVLRLPAQLRGGGQPSLRLRDERGTTVSTGAGESWPCSGAGWCYRFGVGGQLSPGRYLVEGPFDARWDSGLPVPLARPGAFSVGEQPDLTPPLLGRPEAQWIADCLRVRLQLDEPARVVVRVGAAILAAGEGTAFDLLGRVAGVPPGTASLVVSATDWADNAAESPDERIEVPATPPLVISELLANPAGAELTQEFVELVNLGDRPVPLAGMSIEDGAGFDPLPPSTLDGHAYALVVAMAYQPSGGPDPPPREGTLLLRVPGRIGRDGLGNGGEVVRLRGADGAVVSQYGGWVDTGARLWNGQSVQRTALDACDEPSAWSAHPMAPTPGW
jgi:hypothetical protein